MKRLLTITLSAVMAMPMMAQDYPMTQKSKGNPLFVDFPSQLFEKEGTGPFYSADASARVWNINGKEVLYVYCSHDMEPAVGCDRMDRYHVFSTEDMKTWTDHGEILNAEQTNKRFGLEQPGFMWAPDCVYNPNDKLYYFYFPHAVNFRKGQWKIFVATSKDPATGFELRDTIQGAPSAIDPNVFVDDDGQPYLIMGGGAQLYGGKLNKNDWTKLDGEMKRMTGTEDFHEGAWVFKHNGKYYLSYPDNYAPQKGGNRMRYAVSDSPLGPWEYKGIYMYPHGEETAHGSVVQFKGKWYQFYHTGNYSGQGTLRSVCVDPLTIKADGTFEMIRNWGTTKGKAPKINGAKTVRIEAENYNNGGSHYGFFKRPENGTIAVEKADGRKYVKSLLRQEWTRYTVNVEKAGKYNFVVAVKGNQNDSKFTLSIDGTWVKPEVQTGKTGEWNEVVCDGIQLEEGEHFIEIRGAGGDIALDYITVNSL